MLVLISLERVTPPNGWRLISCTEAAFYRFWIPGNELSFYEILQKYLYGSICLNSLQTNVIVKPTRKLLAFRILICRIVTILRFKTNYVGILLQYI